MFMEKNFFFFLKNKKINGLNFKKFYFFDNFKTYKYFFKKDYLDNLFKFYIFLKKSSLSNYCPMLVTSFKILKNFVKMFNFLMKLKFKSGNKHKFVIFFDYKGNYKSILNNFFLKKNMMIFFLDNYNNIGNFDVKFSFNNVGKKKNFLFLLLMKDLFNFYML